MKKFGLVALFVFGIGLCFSGCNIPRPAGFQEFFSPTAITEEPAQNPADVGGITQEPCGFMWATQELPDVSQDLQSKFDQAGLSNWIVRAAAYGENCVKADGSVAYFATMQTDIYLQVEVSDLQNLEQLGNFAEAAIQVIAAYPKDQLPGPNRGYIGITFQNGEEKRLWFRSEIGLQALEDGLTGGAFFDALSQP